MKKKCLILYRTAIVLFVVYIIMTAIPEFGADENKIYFEILLTLPFLLLLLYNQLNHTKNETIIAIRI